MTILLFYLTLLQPVLVHSTCTASVKGSALTRHSYRSFVSGDMKTCYQHCRSEELCQSINFHRHNRICELNNRTDVISPANLIKKEDAFYFSNPFRVKIGSSEKLPALSCQEIKKSSSEAVSGRYWLVSSDQGMARNVYCNMTIGVVVECTGNPCQNGAACHYQGSGRYTCSCKPGYTGAHCEKDIDDCAGQPCLNGGNCTDDVDSFKCNCTAGFKGSRCELHPAVECSQYQIISDATRNVNATKQNISCDRALTRGWYRFTGAAGTKMPTTCVAKRKCNTHATGWLNGTNPTMHEGVVSRQVCFHWSTKCCNWQQDIQVRNCGYYWIYKLEGTKHCSLRFCATF